MLEMSNVELRSRILYYQSETFAVPLIYQSQIAYERRTPTLRYVPEMLFNMLEGFGVLSFGVGSKCCMQSGKSQLLNDLMLPYSNQDSEHSPFTESDKTAFSNGQVDVFFEKAFDNKRDAVFMDGQGRLTDETIQNCLCLCNLVIV